MIHLFKKLNFKLLIVGLMVLSIFGRPVASSAEVTPITANQAHRLIEEKQGSVDFVILDIRTPNEFAAGHISGAVLLDYYAPDFIQKLQKLDKSTSYLIYCRSGNRSGRTLQLVEKMGFSKIYHLQRGIIDWVGSKFGLVR